jgi:hypothetical protein
MHKRKNNMREEQAAAVRFGARAPGDRHAEGGGGCGK